MSQNEKKELIDCIHNLMAVLDSPLGRLKIKGNFADEAREQGREIMKKNNRSLI